MQSNADTAGQSESTLSGTGSISQTAAMTGARPQDIETGRIMNDSETETTPAIPVENLDAGDVANAQEVARGGLGAGPVGVPIDDDLTATPGAPFDQADDAARMGAGRNPNVRPSG